MPSPGGDAPFSAADGRKRTTILANLRDFFREQPDAARRAKNRLRRRLCKDIDNRSKGRHAPPRRAGSWHALHTFSARLFRREVLWELSSNEAWDIALLVLLVLDPEFETAFRGLVTLPPFRSRARKPAFYAERRTILLDLTDRIHLPDPSGTCYAWAERARDHIELRSVAVTPAEPVVPKRRPVSARGDDGGAMPDKGEFRPAAWFRQSAAIPSKRLEAQRRTGKLKKSECKKPHGHWQYSVAAVQRENPEDATVVGQAIQAERHESPRSAQGR